SDKATWTFHISAPKGFVATANGELTHRTPRADARNSSNSGHHVGVPTRCREVAGESDTETAWRILGRPRSLPFIN
ncbi:hypothetical protein ABZ695_29965, partial [Streptomyces sp. NPDC006976]